MELIIGIFIGVLLTNVVFSFFMVGDLNVIPSEPGERPYLIMALNKDVSKVTTKRVVVLKVKHGSLK